MIVNINGQDVIIDDAPEPVQAPASVDWTTKGVVTPVKNQGQCSMKYIYFIVRKFAFVFYVFIINNRFMLGI